MSIQAIFLDGAPAILDEMEKGYAKRIKFLQSSIASIQSGRKILVSNTGQGQLAKAGVTQNSNELEVVTPNGPTRGALASALLAIDLLSEPDPIVLFPTNSITNFDVVGAFLRKMQESKVAAGIMLIESNNPHFSYARVHEGKVIEIIEKIIVGNLATTGVFYFRDKSVLKECSRWAFVNNQSTDGKFYIAPSLNYVLSAGGEFGFQIVDSANYQHLTW
jgi:dTDP-glucose pyrophosphorylase